MKKLWEYFKRGVKKIFEIIENPDGSFSSRRFAGLALVVCGVVGWFMGKDTSICAVIMGLGSALLGLTTADGGQYKSLA